MYLSNILHIIGECFLNKNKIGGGVLTRQNMLSKYAFSNLCFNTLKCFSFKFKIGYIFYLYC